MVSSGGTKHRLFFIVDIITNIILNEIISSDLNLDDDLPRAPLSVVLAGITLIIKYLIKNLIQK